MSSKSIQSSVALQGQSSCYKPAITNHYRVLQDTAEGGFIQVKLASHLFTGTEAVVKVLSKVASNFPLFSELDMMKALDHQNTIQLFQVIETIDCIYIVVEHEDGGRLWTSSWNLMACRRRKPTDSSGRSCKLCSTVTSRVLCTLTSRQRM
ncbi:Hypothetical predicted protein [Marmota monax]|uniref:non-specific serine/threonine protein kinase n=1 Tax=Marmota monax TaxID=9995 RepID=A0A5E4CIG8_MARMO|nr:hypothetical protein GHT09_005515 [Marmota monax]VTJ80731.1 Hypothetical predicted protein [Marmota monax]